MPRSKTQFFLLLFIVICAWAGIVLQFDTGVIVWIHSGVPVSQSLVRFFSYFTILTNLLIAVTSTTALFIPGTKTGQFCSRPGTVTAITVYIIVVGMVYNLVLRPLYHPQGWARLGDELVHVVVPLLYTLYWFLFATRENIRWGSAFKWLLYPFLYLVYTFLHGLVTHYYPYPFMDVTSIGYTGFWLNSFYLLILFVVLNFAMIASGKAIAKRRALSSVYR